ncbi:hypothetical protein EsH8_XIV_000047 [Colletotrichum jinshuiense]
MIKGLREISIAAEEATRAVEAPSGGFYVDIAGGASKALHETVADVNDYINTSLHDEMVREEYHQRLTGSVEAQTKEMSRLFQILTDSRLPRRTVFC